MVGLLILIGNGVASWEDYVQFCGRHNIMGVCNGNLFAVNEIYGLMPPGITIGVMGGLAFGISFMATILYLRRRPNWKMDLWLI